MPDTQTLPDETRAFDQQPVTALKGVGPRLAATLGQRLGIETVQDLLFHLPYRYEDRTRISPIGSLRPGVTAVVEGEIELAEVRFGRRRSLLVSVADGTGLLTLRFFHFSARQQAGFQRGMRIRCYGEVRRGPATLEMVHPEYRLVDGAEAPALAESLTPVYPATEGVQQPMLRRLTGQALACIAHGDGLRELLPEELLRRFRLSDLRAALRYVHRPPGGASLDALESGEHPAQQRLAFEELLAHQLSLRRLRVRARHQRAPALGGDGRMLRRFRDQLPFSLTAAQTRVVDQILSDLAQSFPMMRLVQGDVGSGKTVVAAMAVLRAVEAGHQAAIMAPTELLAEQHYRNFVQWLQPLGIEVAWLSGKLRAAQRREMLAALAEGRAPVAVGTHALFQDDVEFDRLGLIVVDEQHRFGVHQRLALRDKGRQGDVRPHQLTMTATPIPRTLAMALYADLDLSVIDELPPGRKPVATVVIADSRRDEVIERVRAACREGRQAYWVCTLIEDSETLAAQAAEETERQLVESLPELRIGLVHGRMKPVDKEAVMARFKEGGVDLLVATTVIEVGVDVPRASLMIIDNAERLGLAQLHQLRGRIGRGSEQSTCVLMYHPPLSRTARARLAVLRETNDGFEIARRDLELRGPGEVLGTRQTGLLALRIADLLRDQQQLPKVEAAADLLLEKYPDRVGPLIRRWLGEATRYAQV